MSGVQAIASREGTGKRNNSVAEEAWGLCIDKKCCWLPTVFHYSKRKRSASAKFPLLIPGAGKSYTITEDKKKKILRYKSLLLFPSFGKLKEPKKRADSKYGGWQPHSAVCSTNYSCLIIRAYRHTAQHSSHKSLRPSVAFGRPRGNTLPSFLNEHHEHLRYMCS